MYGQLTRTVLLTCCVLFIGGHLAATARSEPSGTSASDPEPFLVMDINATATDHSTPKSMVGLDGSLFFSATDGTHGRELWKSDGTEPETVLVKDIHPGSGDSHPFNMTSVGEVLYFSADDGIHGRELWKSDGTEAGTTLIKDINPGDSSSEPGMVTSLNGMLFFTANDGTHGRELWMSDGTGSGTVLVKDIRSGSEGSDPSTPVAMADALYLVANDGIHGGELWRSDGTESGTVLVKDIRPGFDSSGLENLTNVDGTLFFTLYVYLMVPGQLWKSDGTEAGTVQVKVTGGTPAHLTNFEGTPFFLLTSGLWKSDGTEAGTLLVSTISAKEMVRVADNLFISSGSRLWISDGTTAGTVQIKHIDDGTGGSTIGHLFDVNGTLYFAAIDGSHGRELWTSDGTESGTRMVRDIYPAEPWGIPSGFPHGPQFGAVGSALFFTAEEGRHGFELWTSDGTEANTTLVRDINSVGVGSFPSWLTSVDGIVLFSADDGVHGAELWKSNGSETCTLMVKDIYPAWGSGVPSGGMSLAVVDGVLFLSACDESNGCELWKSDGTEEGTVLVKDFTPAGSTPLLDLTAVNDLLFFTAQVSPHGYELWKSDGTEAGTVMVKDLSTSEDGSSPGSLTEVNGVLFFTADDGTHGRELWKSDGTEEGTVLVKDIYPGEGPSGPSLLTSAGEMLFFAAGDASHGIELWMSDGTQEGTQLVSDIWPGRDSGLLGALQLGVDRALAHDGTTLFFAGEDSHNGVELWKSDGTDGGTVMVKDIRPGYDKDSSPEMLTSVDGLMLFRACEDTHGCELWKSDGTQDGTVMVKAIDPRTEVDWPSGPWGLIAVDDVLFFVVDDGVHGQELWQSDGTEVGTFLVKDINLGDPSSLEDRYSARPVRLGGGLLFGAHDGMRGTELWALGVDDCPCPSSPLLVAPGDGASACDETLALQWQPVSGAAAYRIHVATDDSFANRLINTLTTGPNYVPGSSLPIGTYYWRVQSLNVCGEGGWSQVWHFTTEKMPAAPVLGSPPDGSSTVDLTPTFAWSPAEGATTHRLQVDIDEAFAAPVVDETVSEASYTPELPLDPGGYYWRVGGANTCGEGAWSSTWRFRCQSCQYLPVILRN